MLVVLNQFLDTEKNIQVTEYTSDGKTVLHRVETPIPSQTIEIVDSQPTIGEQILAETQYQTALLEMNTLGGI